MLDKKMDKLIDITTRLSEDVGEIKNDISGIKGQLDENTQIIKALVHRADELDAKYDCLLHTTATKDLIANLDNKFNVLNDRLFQQEAKILSLVK